MDKITDEKSDAVLYRNIYTKILSQQIHAENRLHRLMMAQQGQGKIFNEHLAKVRAKVEKDRIRNQKLGGRLVNMERKEMEIVSKADCKETSENTSITRERRPSMFATLLNMESLRDQFELAQNSSPGNETNGQINNNTSVTPNQNNFAQTSSDPEEMEMFFENPVSHNPNTTTSTLLTKAMNEQGHSKKFKNLSNSPWFASDALQDILPKRVSFNDIPDVIAEQEIGNEKLLANDEARWKSDYSENQPGEACEQNHKHSRYHEPPPDFSHYSYHDRNRRNDPESAAKTTGHARTHNQSLNRRVEHLLQESPKSCPKCSEPVITGKTYDLRSTDVPSNTSEGIWELSSDQENSPFRTPWEGVISSSLQRQRNDSTQAVASSTTNNEDDVLTSKTVENTSVETVPDTCINKSSDDTTAKLFKMEPKEQNKFEKWLNLHKDNDDSKHEINEDTELYEPIVKDRRHFSFIKDDALTSMRRQSWSIHHPAKKEQKIREKFTSVFRRPVKNNRASQFIKADKKEFHVTKKVRRRMSLRPLPETPDVGEENEHALQCNTADSLDTFH